MTLQQIAELIPAVYRKEILDLKLIENAQAVHTCDNMHYLFTIWTNYIEQGLEMDCGLCIQRVLNNYKQLLPVLAKMEKEKQLLDAIN